MEPAQAEKSKEVQCGAPSSSADVGGENQIAIVVCHGMGQQVPFETIETVATIVRRPGAKEASPVTVRIIELTNDKNEKKRLPRAEVEVVKDEREKEVHVYEAYWAPLTEGKVTLRDVHAFLIEAGWNGIKRSVGGHFKRWIFGGFKDFRVSTPKLVFYFAMALGILWALTLLNGAILAAASARVLTRSIADWPSNALLADLSCDALVLAVPMFFLGLTFTLALEGPKVFRQPLFLHVVNGCVWAGVFIIPGVGLLVLYHLIRHHNGTAGLWWQGPVTHIVIKGYSYGSIVLRPISIALIWAALLYVSKKARWFLIQYVGDVAAYISAHTVSKFYETRQQIQEVASSVARAVYQAKKADGKTAVYSKIVMVGHSLGSVIAYDTLNAMILDDALHGGSTKVLDRTNALITFGSPLDKTAFIFRTQQEEKMEIREALAAAVQPMIVDYKLRPFKWINIHSPRDWISGPVDYYDDPEDHQQPRRAEDKVDPDATIPLAAHTQYWKNPMLAGVLYDAIYGKCTPENAIPTEQIGSSSKQRTSQR